VAVTRQVAISEFELLHFQIPPSEVEAILVRICRGSLTRSCSTCRDFSSNRASERGSSPTVREGEVIQGCLRSIWKRYRHQFGYNSKKLIQSVQELVRISEKGRECVIARMETVCDRALARGSPPHILLQNYLKGSYFISGSGILFG
jgi:hypothetical protein